MLTTPTQTSLTSQPVLLDSLNTLTIPLPPSPIHLRTVSIRSDYSEIQLTLNWVTGSASALFVPQRFDRDVVWGLTRVGPRNHVLDGSPDPQGKGQFWGLPCPFKSFGNLAAVYAKTAEPIKMPFGGEEEWLAWAEETMYYMGSRFPSMGMDNFWSLSRPFNSRGSLCCGVCSKRDHFILNNDCLLQPTAVLPIWSVPPRCCFFVKILWPPVYVYY